MSAEQTVTSRSSRELLTRDFGGWGVVGHLRDAAVSCRKSRQCLFQPLETKVGPS